MSRIGQGDAVFVNAFAAACRQCGNASAAGAEDHAPGWRSYAMGGRRCGDIVMLVSTIVVVSARVPAFRGPASLLGA